MLLLALTLYDVAMSDLGRDVGWWHHRFTQYTDTIHTEAQVYRFQIYPRTRLKIAISRFQNANKIQKNVRVDGALDNTPCYWAPSMFLPWHIFS